MERKKKERSKNIIANISKIDEESDRSTNSLNFEKYLRYLKICAKNFSHDTSSKKIVLQPRQERKIDLKVQKGEAKRGLLGTWIISLVTRRKFVEMRVDKESSRNGFFTIGKRKKHLFVVS